jgi:hypothetical protein
MVAKMVEIPHKTMEILNDPNAVKIIATKAADGSVHAIRVGSMAALDNKTVIVGAILMKRTGKNLEAMKQNQQLVSLLVNKDLVAFEIMVAVKDYLTSGPIFDGMNAKIKPMGMAARGVWVFEPKEVWNQSATYEAGTKVV